MTKKKNPFLICEISANHCGSILLAKKLIKCAKKYGADAVKIQTFTADTMTVNSNKKYFKIKNGLWKGFNLWDLYNKGKTPLTWHKELFHYAKKIGITIFSTPFDESAVTFLQKLNCPIYKVASFEMTDHLLIKKIALTKKPMIISTGMASLREIEQSLKVAKKFGAKNITLLYCVSNYPSKISDFNLNNIKIMKKKFKCKIGLSDHSKDDRVAMVAVALGAEVIEKHIALDKQKKGLDIDFSLKGKEIERFRQSINLVSQLKGKDSFFRNKSEDKSKNYRRSIFVVKNIKKGEKFSNQNIKRIRPGHGISPVYFDKILGKTSPLNLRKETPLEKKILKALNIKVI
jgi:pseudaminic acid synthase